jgi:hypothetical protein
LANHRATVRGQDHPHVLWVPGVPVPDGVQVEQALPVAVLV